MRKPPRPVNEELRLAALRRLAVLDTPPEERFDRITRLAARLFDVPIALISLVDAERQWFKSRVGLAAAETPRSISFCGHAIVGDEVLIVPDAGHDPRFADNPLVVGEPHIVFYAGWPLAGPDGHKVGTLCLIDRRPRDLDTRDLGVLHDLARIVADELMDAERREAELNRRVVSLVEGMSDAFVALDTGWRYTYVNRRAGELFNRRPEDLIGKHIWTEFPEDVGQPFYHAYHKAMAEHIPIRLEEYYPPYDRWFENRIDPSPHGLSIYFQDITERKRAEEALRESEERYRTLIEQASDGIFISDDRGVFLDVNTSGCRMSGYSREELLRMRMSDVVPPDDLPLLGSVQEEIRAGQGVLKEWRLKHKDGTLIPVEVGSTRLSDGRLQGIARNITERKRAEESLQRAYHGLELQVRERTAELTRANEKLKELDRLKSEFLATMSHELRTPLNSVIGFVGMILQGLTGDINPEQRKQLSMVYGSAKHLLTLINDVLDLSRIESGRMEVVIEDFAVADVIAEVTESLALAASQKGFTLRTELEDARLTMRGDRKKVFQIVLNLVNNAVKFTERGEVCIACRTEGDVVDLAVSDTGIGIAKENMAYLFEAFRQIDGTARRRYEGTGLGLYLSSRVLKK